MTLQMHETRKGGAERAKKQYLRRKSWRHDNAESGVGERRRCGLDDSWCREVRQLRANNHGTNTEVVDGMAIHKRMDNRNEDKGS